MAWTGWVRRRGSEDLFGTASGRTGSYGTVFEIAKTASGYASSPATLVSFNGTDGAFPYGSLVANANGDLLGTTSKGGTWGDGTVFEIMPICFLAGTQIATPTGEVSVERLAVGERVLTHGGAARRIAWIGKGQVLATPGRRTAATPVIVRKGALAENVPNRDLRITKAHSLYIDDVLIPVEFLVNHRSILWDDRAQDVALYHVALDTHDVLLANAAPAETYRDDGNRWLFQNTNRGWALPPQPSCAPVLIGGPVVDAAWRRLLERAGPRPGFRLTDDADAHLVVDGARLDAASIHGGIHTFRLLTAPHSVRLVSRAAAPAELGLLRDPRILGVAVRKVAVWQGRRVALMEAADGRLKTGFHGYELDAGLRWTNGDAVLPLDLFTDVTGPFTDVTGPLDIELHLTGSTQYPLLDDRPVRVAA